MKQQLVALGASLLFVAIGAVYLLVVHGLAYIPQVIALLDGDIFSYLALTLLILGTVVGFQQVVYWLVIRRMENARA